MRADSHFGLCVVHDIMGIYKTKLVTVPLKDKEWGDSKFEQEFSLLFLFRRKSGSILCSLLLFYLPTRAARQSQREQYCLDSIYTQGTFPWGEYVQTDNFQRPQLLLDDLLGQSSLSFAKFAKKEKIQIHHQRSLLFSFFRFSLLEFFS